MRDPDLERRKRLIARIIEDVERLGQMITNLLQVRKIEEGRLETAPKPLGLRELVEDVLQEFGPVLDEHEIEVERDVAEDLRIHADRVAVHSVLRNLIDNAAKAIGEAEERKISLVAAVKGREVEVRVKDTGSGFPPAEGPRLFDKFYRLGDELVRSTAGSGLGLYLSRRLVELDRGTISAFSEGPGLGAEFRVTWPTWRETT
jgi:signal transduction histidine kinase